jgi:NADH dehydrogenase
MTIKSVCVLGGSGFVGSQIVTRLVDGGRDVLVPTRRRARHRHLLVLPRARLIEADIHDPARLRELFSGVDAVINLVGILNESGHDGSGFRRAHVELAQKILEAARETGIKRIVQMSGLNADAAKGPSHYLRSKGEAENHLHTFCGDIAVTSLRPSVIFGPGDSFFNRFATLLRLTPGVFPLTCPGARLQPVYVGDVAAAFVDALEDHSSYGQRRDLCGPEAYTLQELVEYTARTAGLKRLVLPLPDAAARMTAWLSEYILPGKFFSIDNYDSLKVDSVCKDGPPCPTAIEAVVPTYIGKANRDARYQRLRTRAGR